MENSTQYPFFKKTMKNDLGIQLFNMFKYQYQSLYFTESDNWVRQ